MCASGSPCKIGPVALSCVVQTGLHGHGVARSVEKGEAPGFRPSAGRPAHPVQPCAQRPHSLPECRRPHTLVGRGEQAAGQRAGRPPGPAPHGLCSAAHSVPPELPGALASACVPHAGASGAAPGAWAALGGFCKQRELGWSLSLGPSLEAERRVLLFRPLPLPGPRCRPGTEVGPVLSHKPAVHFVSLALGFIF